MGGLAPFRPAIMTRVGPGLYRDAAGALHVVIPAFLRDHGIPDSDTNCALMVAIIRRHVVREFRDAVAVRTREENP
jgi:hypothetical protein